MHINPYEHDQSPEDEGTTFACSCGDPDCLGDNRDEDNRLLGKAWYAASCKTLRFHPEIVRERELASRDDVYRDDLRRSGR